MINELAAKANKATFPTNENFTSGISKIIEYMKKQHNPYNSHPLT